MSERTDIADDLVASRRADRDAMPADMPRWMAATVLGIDRFSRWTGRAVSWLTLPLIAAMIYEIAARYIFTAPTAWAYDISRMIYGAFFVLGAGYALSKGVHIRSDFLYRNWSVRTQGRVDVSLYALLYFPSMLIFLWVSGGWAWTSLSRAERGMDTAWMPLLGPVKACLPIAVALLLVQGVAELLKALHAARKGHWPGT